MSVCSPHDVHAVGEGGKGGSMEEASGGLGLGLVGGEGGGAEGEVGGMEGTEVLQSSLAGTPPTKHPNQSTSIFHHTVAKAGKCVGSQIPCCHICSHYV